MSRFKQISVLILSVYFTVTLGGISIAHHHCGCDLQSEQTFSMENDHSCCEGENQTHSHESQPQEGCHDIVSPFISELQCTGNECETEVTELAIDGALPIVPIAISPLEYVGHLNAVILHQAIALEENSNTITKICFDYSDTSPPKAGKLLLILYQTLKIPFPIS